MCRVWLSWDSSSLLLSSTSLSLSGSFLLVLIFPFRDSSILCVTGDILEGWEDVVCWFLTKQYSLKLITSHYPVSSGYHSLCQEVVDLLLYSGISLSGTAVSNQIPHTVCRQFTVML